MSERKIIVRKSDLLEVQKKGYLKGTEEVFIFNHSQVTIIQG